MTPSDERYLLSCLGRIAEAQERIAQADERRNELLEADAARREDSWEAEIKRQDALIRGFAGFETPDVWGQK